MKKIVVCVDLNSECTETLKRLPKKMDLADTKIHFLHVFENRMYDNDLAPFSFPLPEQDIAFEKIATSTLLQIGKDLDLNPNNVVAKCFFSVSRFQKIKSYAEEVDADLIVLATRDRHGIAGFFSSSLADFLCKYSPCNFLVLRP